MYARTHHQKRLNKQLNEYVYVYAMNSAAGELFPKRLQMTDERLRHRSRGSCSYNSKNSSYSKTLPLIRTSRMIATMVMMVVVVRMIVAVAMTTSTIVVRLCIRFYWNNIRLT